LGAAGKNATSAKRASGLVGLRADRAAAGGARFTFELADMHKLFLGRHDYNQVHNLIKDVLGDDVV
jgi:hypothetical protein